MSNIRSDGQMTRVRCRAAGLHVVIEDGWQALTFKAVAGKLPDVSWQTVKHHFKTHGQLLEATREHMRDMVQPGSQFGRQNAELVPAVEARLAELEALGLAS